jgi:hypothetical protein
VCDVVADPLDEDFTELNVPRRTAWRVMMPNHVSIWLIQEDPTGVK